MKLGNVCRPARLRREGVSVRESGDTDAGSVRHVADAASVGVQVSGNSRSKILHGFALRDYM